MKDRRKEHRNIETLRTVDVGTWEQLQHPSVLDL